MGLQTSSSSSTSYSYSSSASVNGGQPQVSGSRYASQTTSDNSGTRVQTASQQHGQPAVFEERNYDASGRPLVQGVQSSGNDRRIEDVTESENDRLYRERMEDE